MTPRQPFRVLFLCTGNSARSILAEFILNARAHGRFEAFSAGANPTGKVNPFVAEILRHQFRAESSEARSKSCCEFEGQHFDFIITLREKAREMCTAWSGRPMTAYWGIPDPATAEGTHEQKRHAVLETATLIATRIGLFTALREADLDGMRLREWRNPALTISP